MKIPPFLCCLVGLTSHLGDSGMKNNPIICKTEGMAPEKKNNYRIIKVFPTIFLFGRKISML